MKSILFLFLLAPAIVSFDASLNAITQAIRNGDANTLGQYFDTNVEVAILNKEDNLSKAQAVGVVKNFFAKHRPNSYSLVHQGASKGADSSYCIGNLVATGGTFRVYLYMKTSGNQYLIQEIRIEEE